MTNYTNRYIDYTYGADGKLIRKQTYDNNILQKTIDYIGGFINEATVETVILSSCEGLAWQGKVLPFAGGLFLPFFISFYCF